MESKFCYYEVAVIVAGEAITEGEGKGDSTTRTWMTPTLERTKILNKKVDAEP